MNRLCADIFGNVSGPGSGSLVLVVNAALSWSISFLTWKTDKNLKAENVLETRCSFGEEEERISQEPLSSLQLSLMKGSLCRLRYCKPSRKSSFPMAEHV